MYLIITSSPNNDGLTSACGIAALEGITFAGGDSEWIDISAAGLEPCRICNDGWGTCWDNATCSIGDSLSGLQGKIRSAEGVMLITPVYFSQPSERMKYFLDRFRRCEAFNLSGSAAAGKQFFLIAAAGSSGNGAAECLSEMERWCKNVGAVPYECIGISRYNRTLMLQAIKDSAERMVRGEYHMSFNREH